MAVLIVEPSTRRITLAARSIVGRAPGCSVRVDDQRASAEHACIYWRGAGWHVRDLGSTNGTWVGSERLRAGETRPLDAGRSIYLGAADGLELRLADDFAPVARAVAVEGDAARVATQGLLQLPDAEAPQLTIFSDDDGWRSESIEGGSVLVADQQIVEVAGARWRLDLPPDLGQDPVDTTESDRECGIALERCRLRFQVSRDEEFVQVHVVDGARSTPLTPRTFHYMLVTLARRRLADAAAGLPAADHGWTYADDLARMLGTTKPKLNLDVCRVRQQLAEAGVAGAARIIERRPTSQQLRIGVGALEVAAGEGQGLE